MAPVIRELRLLTSGASRRKGRGVRTTVDCNVPFLYCVFKVLIFICFPLSVFPSNTYMVQETVEGVNRFEGVFVIISPPSEY